MLNKYKFQEIDRNSYTPIYVQVSEMIIEYINHEKLKQGDKLPSENELISRLNISRNTIRLAVERLVNMDIAVKVKGRGTFLKESKKGSIIQIAASLGFEESLKQTNQKVENEVIEKRALKGRLDWMDGLCQISSEKKVFVRRRKVASGKILALEDRILPAYVLDRYSEEEMKKENISPTLIFRYPDTFIDRFRLHFISRSLNKEESKLLKVDEGSTFLQRIGEYHNSVGECFMLSRYIIVSEQIAFSYTFEMKEDYAKLTR